MLMYLGMVNTNRTLLVSLVCHSHFGLAIGILNTNHGSTKLASYASEGTKRYIKNCDNRTFARAFVVSFVMQIR